MKRIIAVVVVMLSSVVLAHGYHHAQPAGGGWNSGRHHGGWRPQAPAQRWVNPAPVVRVYPRLPMGVVSLRLGARPYWYGGGTFYAPSASGYVVTAPPVGATLTALPDGAVTQVVNGVWYATASNALFQWDGARGLWVVVSSAW